MQLARRTAAITQLPPLGAIRLLPPFGGIRIDLGKHKVVLPKDAVPLLSPLVAYHNLCISKVLNVAKILVSSFMVYALTFSLLKFALIGR